MKSTILLGKTLSLFLVALVLVLTNHQVDAKLGAPEAADTEAAIQAEEDLIAKIVTSSHDNNTNNNKSEDEVDEVLHKLKLVERQRKLNDLQSYGGRPDPIYIPLGECEGDCDDDRDCESGLVCFHRDGGESVPGCWGNDRSRNDYCIRRGSPPFRSPVTPPTNPPIPAPTNPPVPAPTRPPVPAPTQPPTPMPYINKKVDIMGNNGFPLYRFPLGLCEGDCDHDGECQQGLVCFQRNNFVPVPGCLGGDQDASRSDYCIPDPVQRAPPPTYPNGHLDMTHPTQPAPTQPAPTQPAPTQPAPTVVGYTAPEATIKVNVIGKNYVPPEVFPLGLCMGDCDEDVDCAGNLICFHHDRNQAVPGCLEGEDDSSLSDYCIVDPNTVRAPPPTNPPPTKSPTRNPTKAPTRPPTKAPTRPPTKAPTRPPTKAPTRPPTKAPTPLPYRAPPTPFPYRAPPTPVPYRAPPTPAPYKAPSTQVPGGAGGPPRYHYYKPPTRQPAPTRPPTMYLSTSGVVYTNAPAPTDKPTKLPTTRPPTKAPTPIPTRPPTPNPTTKRPTPAPTELVPTPAPTPRPIPQPYHNTRLRLWWEEGFTWQESTKEKFWCMMYDYRGKPGTGRCWRGEKTEVCSRDEMYIAQCNSDSRQRFSVIFINLDEVMIKTARYNRCFQRDGYKIVLRECDSNNDLQRWFSPRGAFFQRRFEISNRSLNQYCATQEHHPKHGEVVYLEMCAVSRHPFHQSNFWMRWD